MAQNNQLQLNFDRLLDSIDDPSYFNIEAPADLCTSASALTFAAARLLGFTDRTTSSLLTNYELADACEAAAKKLRAIKPSLVDELVQGAN